MEENLPNTNQDVNIPPQETVPITDPQPQPVEEKPTQKRKLSAIKIIMFIIILLLLCALGYMIYQNNQLKSQLAYKPIETPTPSLEPIPTPNPTANWPLYTNTLYNYSIKYPQTFLTQNLTAGAGETEALPTSRHIFIFNTKNEETYVNRYIEIQHFDLETPMSGGYTKTNTAVGNKSAIKYTSTDPGVLFDIYRVNLDNNQGILEINVTNFEDKKEVAKQILSTFQFIDNGFICPDTKIIDCTPCEGGPCPLMFPAYCSKGSAQYNWIVENCPDVTIVGLE